MDSEDRSAHGPGTVLIFGGDPAARRLVGRCLDGTAAVLEASREAEAADLLGRTTVDVLILARGRQDARAPEEDSGPCTPGLREAAGGAVVVEIGPEEPGPSLQRAARHGLWDVIGAGRDPAEIRHRVARAAEHSRLRRQVSRLQADLDRRFGAGSLLGSSPVMERLRHSIRKAGPVEEPVILCGEKGAGRERAARALHMSSSLRTGPFLSISPDGMDALSPSRLPRGGTLFLRDLNECRASSRSRLFRDLAAARGSVRLVASLAAAAPREELPSRLSTDLAQLGRPARIDIPSLRERRGDVPLLASHFLERFRSTHGRPLRSISPEAMSCMEAYPWPGNVRELEDLVESLVLVVPGESLEERHLPPHLLRSRSRHALVMPAIPEEGVMWQNQVDSFQRGLLEQALALSSGKKVEAARRLGLKKDQMKYLCRKYGL